MKGKVQIDPDIARLIESSEITERSLKLPPGPMLDRRTYDRFMRVINALGGTWSKKAQRHLFERDPRPLIAEALGNGAAVNIQQARQSFFTPPAIARMLVRDIAFIVAGEDVLEPSAGRGALALAAREAGANVLCIETDPFDADELKRAGFTAFRCDFLGYEPCEIYDAVIMNPPFTKGQDIDHVLHAMKFLKPRGRLVAIMSKSWTFATTKKAISFRAHIQLSGQIVATLAAGTFKESGTMIETVVVLLRHPGKK